MSELGVVALMKLGDLLLQASSAPRTAANEHWCVCVTCAAASSCEPQARMEAGGSGARGRRRTV